MPRQTELVLSTDLTPLDKSDAVSGNTGALLKNGISFGNTIPQAVAVRLISFITAPTNHLYHLEAQPPVIP